MFVNVPIGVAVWAIGRIALNETEGRHGHFDAAGALTSTLGMGAIVLGLVEAGSDGWAKPVTLGALSAGALLLAMFVRIETRVEEPILPLRLLANTTRTTANISRGLVYAGMYGTFFFLGQFLQDVESTPRSERASPSCRSRCRSSCPHSSSARSWSDGFSPSS